MKFVNQVAAAAVLGATLGVQPAMAQNVGNNAGIWWNPAPAQPSAFTFLNPLTTVYGRIGFLRSFQQNSGLALNILNVVPIFIPGQSNHVPDQWGGMLGVGFRLMPVLRYELQLGGTFNARATLSIPGVANFQTQRVSSVQLMNNLYVDIAPFFANSLWGLNPYVMAGVGASWNTTGDAVVVAAIPLNNTGLTRTSLAWNVGAGVQWQPMRNLILDLGYRYLDAGRYRVAHGAPGFGERFDNTAHQVMFSLVVPVDGLIRGFGN